MGGRLKGTRDDEFLNISEYTKRFGDRFARLVTHEIIVNTLFTREEFESLFGIYGLCHE